MESRMPGSNDGFVQSNPLYADNQHFNTYDNLSLFQQPGDASTFPDASWGVNASDFSGNPPQSRALQAVPSWQQTANHLAATSTQQGYNNVTPSSFARSMNQSPGPFAANGFNNFAGQQTFAYRQQPQYDPALTSSGSSNGQNFNLRATPFSSATPNPGTIAPQALDQNRTFTPSPYGGNGGFVANNFNQNRIAPAQQQTRRVDQNSLVAQIPQGVDVGMFSIIGFDNLSRATNSERMGNYVNIGKLAHDWDITRSATPSYVHRKSRNQLRALAGNNAGALAKICKKSNAHVKSARDARLSAAAGSASDQNIKHDLDSSSEESSSDEDSEYSDEESDTPLPAKRPDTAKGGVEYDVIRSLWRSKRKPIDGATVRECLASFWEVVKTIRDRWKADAAAVTDAEGKKKAGELPLLRSRVRDQREMIEAAFRAALKHGHRGIVELLAENVSLLFLCYQFLLDRHKDEDINGTLARAILELMSAFTTLTQEKLERTHLVKVLPRYQKKGDAKTQHWVKKILANADTATKEAATKGDQFKSEKTDKPAKSITTEVKPDSPTRRLAAATVAGVKRPAAPSTADGAAQKKAATTAAKVNGTTTAVRVNTSSAVKKPNSTADANKGSGATAAPTIRKTVVARPSGFFSSLQSATKKPGTSNAEKAAKPATTKPASSSGTGVAAKPAFSFAETMANLSKPKKEETTTKPEAEVRPEESPDEKAKRLRKEQRRKLHVHFKPATELVQVRYFTHDPDEENDHTASQMRGMSDVGDEGRMLKQQKHMMDIDEDEEEGSEEEVKLIDFREPSGIDFSDVDAVERNRNFAPYGGGVLQPSSEERAKREHYENNNLLVFYTSAQDIPANPKEPSNPYNGDPGGPITPMGLPEKKYVDRVREIAARRSQHRPRQAIPAYDQPPQAAPAFDLSAWIGLQQQAPPQHSDVQAILASLVPATAPAQTIYPPQTPALPTYHSPFMGSPAPNGFPAPPAPAQQIAPPTGPIDLAAILAQVQQQQQQQQQQQVFGNNSAQNSSNVNIADNPFYKTKVCRFFKNGTCQKGDSCSYLHE